MMEFRNSITPGWFFPKEGGSNTHWHMFDLWLSPTQIKTPSQPSYNPSAYYEHPIALPNPHGPYTLKVMRQLQQALKLWSCASTSCLYCWGGGAEGWRNIFVPLCNCSQFVHAAICQQRHFKEAPHNLTSNTSNKSSIYGIISATF